MHEDNKSGRITNSSSNQDASFLNSRVFRNIVIVIVALAIAYGLVRALLIDDEYTILVLSDMSINAAAAAALFFSLLIVFRQKLGGLHGKTYAAFAAGLVLWFAAELVQTYYEIGTEEDVPFPSIADTLWLLGYGPFGYHLFMTYRFFNKSAKPHNLALVLAGTAGVFGSIVPLTILSSSLIQDDPITLFVNVAYPTLDAALIVPAIMMFSILRKGRLGAMPWILLSASILIIAAADSAFGYISATSPDSEIWGFSVFYLTGYLCMAGALYCHNRCFIFDKARAMKVWQEQNR
ncbi:MAG: hypothetical protein MN733_35005 [Nitrososphaera sp.]|nr:hypothetical protein [Nitrososphaera sp.]